MMEAVQHPAHAVGVDASAVDDACDPAHQL